MEKTIRLFDEDNYLKTFEGIVLSCQSEGEHYKVVLDRTAFFPEGGGQYGDQGMLGNVPVFDTKEKEHIIYHFVKEPLCVGEKVKGTLSWDLRFDRMQQHSGEHIISGLVYKEYGYENVGFHLADDYCTMDFNGFLTMEQLLEIEEKANEAVFSNIKTIIQYPSEKALQEMTYRSKISLSGKVRIVEIPGYDRCACCAPHVKQTGEIGIIKIVNAVRYKGGVRVTLLCGKRALNDYQIKWKNAKAIGNLLCEKENQIEDAVVRLKESEEATKNKLLQAERAWIQEKAENISADTPYITVFEEKMSGNLAREYMNLLLKKNACLCCVCSGNERDGFFYVAGSKTHDVRPLANCFRVHCCAKGGGKKEMIQGNMKAKKSLIIEALEQFTKTLE